jgi:hypothetical protein
LLIGKGNVVADVVARSPGKAKTPCKTGGSRRGGRDLNHATLDPVSSSFAELHQQNEKSVGETPFEIAVANGIVTRGVTTPPTYSPTPIANPTDFADLLHQAAETIRSGRLERLTAEWRESMAQACETAAEAVRRRLEGSDSDKDTGRGDPG